MKKQTIAIDIDDVLSDSLELTRQVINAELGVNLTREHYLVPGEYWGYHGKVWEAHGLTEHQDAEAIFERARAARARVEPKNGARAVLQELAREYRLIVVTARDASKWGNETHSWIETHFPGVFENVVFGGGLEGIQLKSKGQLCVEQGAAWLIDDSVEHAHSALENGVRCILFGDYGWHKGQDIHGDVIRCSNWQEVKEYFDAQR